MAECLAGYIVRYDKYYLFIVVVVAADDDEDDDGAIVATTTITARTVIADVIVNVRYRLFSYLKTNLRTIGNQLG